MSHKFDLEDMKQVMGPDTIELPESIKVHWHGGCGEYDFEIKFISKRGVGFPERMCGGKWCGLYRSSICVMPDGTRICAEDFSKNNGNWEERFINAILDWLNGHELKIIEEIEFMDI